MLLHSRITLIDAHAHVLILALYMYSHVYGEALLMVRVCCPLVGRLQAAADRLGGHDLQPQSADSGGQRQAVGGGQSAGAAAPESAAA